MIQRPPRIWDVHCHLSGVVGRTPEERMGRLIEFADRHGIERICLSMGMQFLQHPTQQELRQQNDEVLAALAHYHDRAYGLCYVSGEHVETSLQELDRCVRDGPMVGVKLWVARRCSDRALDAIIDKAAQLQAVIMQHTWFKTDGTQFAGESTPLDIVTLAQRFPQVNMICGHSGGTWELGLRAVRATRNLLVETGGFDPTAGYTEMAVRELGADRIVFGSDAGGRSFASQLSKVVGAEIPDEAQRRILGENLRRLMTPILRAKGLAT
jgi:uncharacterized protein